MSHHGRFPAPVRLSPRAVAWIEAEVSAWIADRAAERKAAA
jgi:prophage regulatory protein